MSLLDQMASAIQQMEGWFPGSVSQRNNNPGNLRAGSGQIGTDSKGYAIFPDYQTGYNALVRQITLNVNKGLTLEEFFGGKQGVYPGYAPAADSNQPNVYAQFVATKLGIDSNVPLSEIMGNLPSSSQTPTTQQYGISDTLIPTYVNNQDPLNSIVDSVVADTSNIDPSSTVIWGVVGIGAAVLLYYIVR